MVKCETIEELINLLNVLDRGVSLTLKVNSNRLNEMEINEILNGKECDYKINVNKIRTLNYFSLNIVKVGRVEAKHCTPNTLKT